MKYVFFDIECASVTKEFAKICVFGYCITDEQFNIIEKEDILVNPKGGFHLTDRKGREGIVLPYDYAAFKNYPAFPAVYPRVRALLEDKDHLVFGHATGNDVKYLNLETRRFHLPALQFEFYDTQLLYMSMIGAFDRQYGLETIMQALGVEFTPHRAADDAYASMRAAQAMCEREGLPMPALLEKYGVLPGKTAKGKTVNGSSRPGTLYQEQKRQAREAREKAHVAFCALIDRKNHKKPVRDGEFYGKIFSFSRAIEYDPPLAKSYIEEVYRRGGRCSSHSDRCDVYVRAAEEGDDRRMQNALAVNAEIMEEKIFREKYLCRNEEVKA